MNKRPKLTLKNLNWPVVWIAIIYIVVVVAVIMQAGCAIGFYARIGDQHIDLSNISAESETKAKVDRDGLEIGE